MRKPLVLVLAVTALGGCQRAQEPALVNVASYGCGELAVSAS